MNREERPVGAPDARRLALGSLKQTQGEPLVVHAAKKRGVAGEIGNHLREACRPLVSRRREVRPVAIEELVQRVGKCGRRDVRELSFSQGAGRARCS